MSQLFSPLELRGLTLANRIMVSPMCQYVAKDGVMHDWHLMNLGQYAMGAAGLVFSEATHVSDIGRITPGCAGLWNDEQETAMKRVVDFCKTWGVSTFGVQIAHAGRKASCNTPLNGSNPLSEPQGAWQTVGPSALGYAEDWHVPMELDRTGMTEVKEQFVSAAKRCERMGVDIIDLHSGHGYLLNQFFSPLANQRSDEYGGSLENRLRFPLEVFEAVRAAWPADKPLGVRISATDWVEGGTTVEDTIVYAQGLKELGCDFIDITSGGNDRRQKIDLKPGYQVGLASAVKQKVDIAICAVGMIRDPHFAESVIADGHADAIMLARGLMYDPRWAWHAAHELGVDTAYADQYIRCKPERWPQAFD